MNRVGSIALYFEASAPYLWKQPEIRADFAERFGGTIMDGLRAGQLLPSRKGYVGFLLCAYTPQGYARLLVAASEAYRKEIEGPWGRAKCIRILADSRSHPWVRALELDRLPVAAPVEQPVKLRTLSPLKSPYSILGELRQAQADLADYPGNQGLKEHDELTHWQITQVRLRVPAEDPLAKTGSFSLWSPHRLAWFILQYALLRGFGALREKGYGSLDVPVKERV
jgi:hypothetical protein